MPNGLRPTDGRHEGSRVPARPVPEQHAPAQQVLGLLLTLKLASLIVVGVLLSVAGLLNRIGTRRSAWLWAALGTFALAGAVIGLGVVVFGSMIALQDQLLPA
jgi:hypothetical protein